MVVVSVVVVGVEVVVVVVVVVVEKVVGCFGAVSGRPGGSESVRTLTFSREQSSLGTGVSPAAAVATRLVATLGPKFWPAISDQNRV